MTEATKEEMERMFSDPLPFEAEVRRGMKLLDESWLGWELDIDLPKLDLGNYRRCIGGHLFGSYSNLGVKLSDLGEFDPKEYGFELPDRVPDGDMDESYRQLTQTWISLIRERQP